MRRIVFLAILVAVTVSTGVKWSSAQSATRAGDLLGLLPDGGAVAVIDFQKIAGSSLWATINAQEKLKHAIDKAQSEMGDLGVKLSDVHTVAVVFPTASFNNPTIALTGGFEQNDLLARLRASGKVKLASEKYKDFDIYKVRSIPAEIPSKERSGTKPAANVSIAAVTKDEASFVFHDATTLVTGNLEAVRASIDAKTGAKPSISRNGKMTDALAQNPTAAIRFALALTPAMTSGLQSSELPIPDFSSVSLIFGTIDVASGIELNATLRSDTAEHANSIAERLNGLLGMAKGFLGAMSDPKMAPIVEALKTVSITSADVDVKITGSLPMDLLTSLLSSSTKKGQ
ncbi:MAG: hypothetical protein AABN33_00355 [Acidobacteriota bacterium]